MLLITVFQVSGKQKLQLDRWTRREDSSLKQVFLFSSQVKASPCQRHQKQQSAEVSERPQAQSVGSLCQRAGDQAAAAKGGVRAWAESWEEWNDETIKPSPLNFPVLLCTFLCCRPCSDCPSHYRGIFSFASNSEAATPLLSKPGITEGAICAYWVRPFRRCIFFNPYRPDTKKEDWVDKMQISIL